MIYQNQHFGISEYFCREQGENFSFPEHMHHSFELVTVLEGNMTVKVADAVYELTVGEGVLIFPEQIHSLKSTKSKHMLIIFSSDIVSAYASHHSSEIPRNNIIAIPPYLQSQLMQLSDSSSIIKMKSALYSVCSLLDDNTEYTKKIIADDGLLRGIFDFIENNYNKECDLCALSKALGYNSSYLSRYFGQVTKMSFTSYVNKYRVGKACYMLKNSDKTVLECAFESGYRSLRSFNRNFNADMGVNPNEYRKGK